MRVATYNIRHGAPAGEGWRGQLAHTPDLVSSVTSLAADVVALQEVDRHVVRSWFRDQAAVLGRACGLRPLFAPTRGFGPGGLYGNAMLVRGDVLEARAMELPWTGERRVALLTRIGVDGHELTVVCTHLQNRRGSGPPQAPGQLDVLIEELGRWPGPLVLMGDFNLRPGSVLPVLRDAGLQAVRGGPTFPAVAPTGEIDWMAVRNLRVDTVSVPDLRTSDHRPIVADLSFVNDPERPR